MKRFTTQTRFTPLQLGDSGKFNPFPDGDGQIKKFKTRVAVEKFCEKNGCIYCEEKYIFYR